LVTFAGFFVGSSSESEEAFLLLELARLGGIGVQGLCEMSLINGRANAARK
jgi:hypothetical protein